MGHNPHAMNLTKHNGFGKYELGGGEITMWSWCDHIIWCQKLSASTTHWCVAGPTCEALTLPEGEIKMWSQGDHVGRTPMGNE